MTSAQAKRLEKAPGVLSVVKDTPRRLTDDKNPVDFLRLSGRDGVWESLGGVDKAGAGTVVGVLDSGFWPESPSFAGAPLGTTPPTSADPYRALQVGNQIRHEEGRRRHLHRRLPGRCDTGGRVHRAPSATTKMIGARYFGDTCRDEHAGRGRGRVRLATRRRRSRQPHRVDRRGQRRRHGRPWTAATSARSPGSPRRPRSRSTRSAGPGPTSRAASTATSCRPSTRPSSTAST